jgi:hypothetical protein
MTSEPNGSVVLAPWHCPECGHTNTPGTSRCVAKRFDSTSPRFEAIPPVPPEVSIQEMGDYLSTLGVATLPPPRVIWECEYVRPCVRCDKPGRPYPHGVRCDDHV